MELGGDFREPPVLGRDENARIARVLARILENKYGFDDLYQRLFGDGAVKVGTGLWKGGDVAVIDGVMVNGSAKAVGWFAKIVRLAQTGLIYQYAFVMIFALFVGLSVWLYWIAFPPRS